MGTVGRRPSAWAQINLHKYSAPLARLRTLPSSLSLKNLSLPGRLTWSQLFSIKGFIIFAALSILGFAAADTVPSPASRHSMTPTATQNLQVSSEQRQSASSGSASASAQADSNGATSSASAGGATSATNDNSSSVSVTVNGVPVDVPQNGSTQQTITNDQGTAKVNIEHHQSANGSSFHSSITSTDVNGNSTQSSSTDSSQVETQFGSP